MQHALQQSTARQDDRTVLREFRSCGWGAYRPQAGRLVLSSTQDWCSHLPAISGRISQLAAQHRMSWLDEDGKPNGSLPDKPEGGKPALPDKSDKSDKPALPDKPELFAPDSKELEVTYDHPDSAVKLDLCQAWLEQSEEKQTEAVQLHPSKRTLEQQYLAELVLLTSQASRGKSVRPALGKWELSRPELAEQWRKDLGRKTAAARLSQMVLGRTVKKKKKRKPAKLKAAKARQNAFQHSMQHSNIPAKHAAVQKCSRAVTVSEQHVLQHSVQHTLQYSMQHSSIQQRSAACSIAVQHSMQHALQYSRQNALQYSMLYGCAGQAEGEAQGCQKGS